MSATDTTPLSPFQIRQGLHAVANTLRLEGWQQGHAVAAAAAEARVRQAADRGLVLGLTLGAALGVIGTLVLAPLAAHALRLGGAL